LALRFVAVDPESGHNGSTTAWVDDVTRDIVLQSYLADDETLGQCAAVRAPDHAPGVPAGEAVVRIPAHLVSMLREACDAAERGL
jgi:hypothetical protein